MENEQIAPILFRLINYHCVRIFGTKYNVTLGTADDPAKFQD